MYSKEIGDEMAQAPLTILVPGFGDREESLQNLEQYLQQSIGQTVTISPQPSNGSIGIEELARRLALQIRRIGVQSESKTEERLPLNLVGFSMGGLICRYYVQFLADEQPIERLITVATPHYGTWNAYAFNCPACIQMRPGSKFLYKLNEDLSALAEIDFVSMWSPFDLTILPTVSSWLPVGEIVTVASPLHQTMTLDPRVLHAISVHLVH